MADIAADSKREIATNGTFLFVQHERGTKRNGRRTGCRGKRVGCTEHRTASLDGI